MKRVLFDSDVLLDILVQRSPFVVASARALDTVTQEQAEVYVSQLVLRPILELPYCQSVQF